MSFVGMLYIHASLCRTAIGVSYCHQCAGYGVVMVIYTHIGVGLRRCSFRLRWAISYEPQNVKRATVQGFTLFLCLQVNVKNTHIVVIRSP